MKALFAQGDLLIELTEPRAPSGTPISRDAHGSTVVAEGELSGHRHTIHEMVTMFRDDALARDIPADLYIGHVNVDGASARLVHEEHGPITLRQGTYRVRRQREFEPKDVGLVVD
jgi:hypothetical protein